MGPNGIVVHAFLGLSVAAGAFESGCASSGSPKANARASTPPPASNSDVYYRFGPRLEFEAEWAEFYMNEKGESVTRLTPEQNAAYREYYTNLLRTPPPAGGESPPPPPVSISRDQTPKDVLELTADQRQQLLALGSISDTPLDPPKPDSTCLGIWIDADGTMSFGTQEERALPPEAWPDWKRAPTSWSSHYVHPETRMRRAMYAAIGPNSSESPQAWLGMRPGKSYRGGYLHIDEVTRNESGSQAHVRLTPAIDPAVADGDVVGMQSADGSIRIWIE